MDKLAGVINTFISNNLNALMEQWDKARGATSIWHNGPIDNAMLEAMNNIVQTISKGEKIPNKIDIIVNSMGGDIEPAYQTISLLDRCFNNSEINFVAPRFSKSAATLMACGCNKVLFSQVGELGPLDVQIMRKDRGLVSGITIKRLVDEELKGEKSDDNMKEWIYRTLKPEEVLEMKRFNDVAVQYLKELLPKRMFPGESSDGKKVCNAIEMLCEKFPSHSFVIDHNTAKDKLGFNVAYVSENEELILQNARELWEYQARLQNAIYLNSENQILKKMLSDYSRGGSYG